MSDYDFERLGPREFEHLAQALTIKALGPLVTVFGDGPDGGREATWDGAVPALSPDSDWDGYGVLQAKFMARPSTPKDNLAWFKSQVTHELDKWADPQSNRTRRPKTFLLVTNTRLSASPGNGKDAADAMLRDEIEMRSLPIEGYRIWDYDDLRGLLDDAESIRRRYAAFLTPGDIVASILDAQVATSKSLATALSVSAAMSLRDDASLNLTQTGVMSETGLTIADAFVDLPSEASSTPHRRPKTQSASGPAGESIDPEQDAFAIFRRASENQGIAARLISHLNRSRSARDDVGVESVSVVVVGGPGQGKSTVTQWLAQLYRVAFLEQNPSLRANRSTSDIANAVKSRAIELNLPEVAARRWPFRIILTEFADHIAANSGATLVDFIASRLTARGSATVNTEDVLAWMERYPWVLFVDGLDEVPPSSNRSKVLQALSDLAIEADTRGGDVVIIATTRPQGYGDELQRYEHVRLQKLSVADAIVCAQALVHVRFGVGTHKSELILERLRKASREPATEKLFESPLQVSILTVLLEKLGKAPGDRSRLFSAYYEVISSREQEKSGDLSDLLQRYEADIRTLHREIGNALQRRSEEEGESSASLSVEEFHDSIAAQFRAQGHEEPEIADLRAEFSRLVTDRLVFLTYVTGERIGFELRSLQEFMAGEYIVSLPESEIIPSIARIALSTYWRNVALFAVGSIFAHRAHLRAEIVLLCQELNRDVSDGSLFPGSELAIDILRDGSCLSMPSYTEGLAATAADVIDGPVFKEIRSLASLRDTRITKVVASRALQTQSAPSSVWLNRLRLRSSGDFPSEAEGLTALYGTLDSRVRRDAARYSWEHGDVELAEICAPTFWDAQPSDYFGGTSGWDSPAEAPLEYGHITYLNEANIWDPDAGSAMDEPLWGTYVPLLQDEPQWTWLRDNAPASGPWRTMGLIASFALGPSPATLAAALRSLAESLTPLPERSPWLLRLCLREAKHIATLEETGDSGLAASLQRLAGATAAGHLGTLENWLNCEAKTPSTLGVNADTIDSIDNEATFDLVARGSTAVPLAAMNFATSTSVRIEHPEKVLATLNAISRVASKLQDSLASAHAQGLGLFLLSVMVDDGFDLNEQTELLDWAAETATSAQAGDDPWWSWASALMGESRHPLSDDVLDSLGLRPRLLRAPNAGATKVLVAAFRSNHIHWPQLRLALLMNPQDASIVSELELESLPGDSAEAEILGCVISFVRQLQEGAVTFSSEQVSRLVCAKGSIDARWLLRAVQGGLCSVQSIGALASAISSHDAVLGGAFVEAASQQLRSAPATSSP